MADCTCPKPLDTLGRSQCDRCGGFACAYADKGQKRCPSWRCDCFIDEYPDSPMELHPEAFTIRALDGGQR